MPYVQSSIGSFGTNLPSLWSSAQTHILPSRVRTHRDPVGPRRLACLEHRRTFWRDDPRLGGDDDGATPIIV